MTPPNTENDDLQFKQKSPIKHIGEVLFIGGTGAIIGVLCGSIIVFSGILTLGIAGKLLNDHRQKTPRR